METKLYLLNISKKYTIVVNVLETDFHGGYVKVLVLYSNFSRLPRGTIEYFQKSNVTFLKNINNEILKELYG